MRYEPKALPDFHTVLRYTYLQGDLVSSISKGIASKDILNGDCNCNTITKLNGTCAYGVEHITCCVVYKVTCKLY